MIRVASTLIHLKNWNTNDRLLKHEPSFQWALGGSKMLNLVQCSNLVQLAVIINNEITPYIIQRATTSMSRRTPICRCQALKIVWIYRERLLFISSAPNQTTLLEHPEFTFFCLANTDEASISVLIPTISHRVQTVTATIVVEGFWSKHHVYRQQNRLQCFEDLNFKFTSGWWSLEFDNEALALFFPASTQSSSVIWVISLMRIYGVGLCSSSSLDQCLVNLSRIANFATPIEGQVMRWESWMMIMMRKTSARIRFGRWLSLRVRIQRRSPFFKAFMCFHENKHNEATVKYFGSRTENCTYKPLLGVIRWPFVGC